MFDKAANISSNPSSTVFSSDLLTENTKVVNYVKSYQDKIIKNDLISVYIQLEEVILNLLVFLFALSGKCDKSDTD